MDTSCFLATLLHSIFKKEIYKGKKSVDEFLIPYEGAALAFMLGSIASYALSVTIFFLNQSLL